MGKLLLRDLTLLLVTLGLWAADAALRQGPGSALALPVAWATGVATALCGYLFHEWGHLVAALLSGSTVHFPDRVASVFLFQFDTDRNDRSQFLILSLGGYLASLLCVGFLWMVLPRNVISGQVALGLTLLGVLATLILELPPAWRVARGAELPTGVAYRSAREP